MQYLLWIRDFHTLKFLHVFKNFHNIAHNIKCDTVEGDTLQVLLSIITYVRENKGDQTRAPECANSTHALTNAHT